MLDNGAPSIAIGYRDLFSLSVDLRREWSGELELIPPVFCQSPYRKYGSAEHHSKARAILGSVMLHAYEPDKNKLLIHHLVLDRASQWVVVPNVTSGFDILYAGETRPQTVGPLGTPMRIALLEHGYHLHLPLSLFSSPSVARAHKASVVHTILN